MDVAISMTSTISTSRPFVGPATTRLRGIRSPHFIRKFALLLVELLRRPEACRQRLGDHPAADAVRHSQVEEAPALRILDGVEISGDIRVHHPA